MSITLEVSVAEALDKLTILEIKKNKISNNEKIKEIMIEYNYLYDKLNSYIYDIYDISRYYYDTLKFINLDIWELQDIFRLNQFNNDFNKNQICQNIIDLNNARFMVKNKINIITNSNFKEQKGYHKNTAYFLSHNGIGDYITMNGAIRFLSIFYDEFYVLVKDIHNNVNNVKLFFHDDHNIKIIPFDDDKIKLITNIINSNKLDFFVIGWLYKDIAKTFIRNSYLSSLILNNNEYNHYYPFHINFYNDVNLPFNIYYDFFFLKQTEDSIHLFNNVKNFKIIFTQSKSSDYSDINLHQFIDKYLLLDDYIVLSINHNYYEESNNKYKYAKLFINLPILNYITTIIHSDSIFIVNSCISCIVLPLFKKKLFKNINNIKIIDRETNNILHLL